MALEVKENSVEETISKNPDEILERILKNQEEILEAIMFLIRLLTK